MDMSTTPEMKSEAINHLVLVCDAHCAASGGSRGALSKHLFDRGGQIDALAAGKRDLQTATLERAMQWLSDNWPGDAEWPKGVARPGSAPAEAEHTIPEAAE